ncbi:MAG: TIGR02186 family protein [Rhodobacteraceae bacterium]|nr:TIGR02186 family protein [Paracoccaceae bacterium]
MRGLALILTLLLALPAHASEIVGALSQNRVSLTASFSGSEILIFGAIRRDADEVTAEEAAEARGDEDFDVVIVIEGPRQPVAVWRKDRRAGIWMNVDSVSLDSVPSFYAVATTGPLNQILTPETDAAFRISARQAIRAEQVGDGSPQSLLFAEALLRIRERSSHYLALDRFVHLDRDILFRANVRLPANLTEGAYTTRMYLVQGGDVVSQFRTAIFVRKDGFERWLHELAYDQPLIYGFLALAIALVAGWGASALFRLIRQQ